MKPSKPTKIQLEAMRRAIAAKGRLIYLTGGFWTVEDVESYADGTPKWWVDDRTIVSLKKQGWLRVDGAYPDLAQAAVTDAGRAVVSAASAAPVTPPRERFRPPWLADNWSSVSHNLHEAADWVGFVRRGRLRLPRFQRGWAWTDAQIVTLVESILHGYHIGQLLLWEHRMPASVERFGEFEVQCKAGPAWLVVDGQQRLGAICTAACSGRFWVDTMAGQLVTEPGPWRMPAAWFLDEESDGHGAIAILDGYEAHAREYGLDARTVCDAAGYTRQAVQRAYIGAVRFGPDWDLARVMESYRRLAVCGTPMDAAEVEEGLRRATLNQGA